MLRSSLPGLLLGCGLALAPPSLAGAVPITYFHDSGSVTLTATAGATTLASGIDASLTGIQVTFDADAPAVVDILLTMAPVGPITLLAPYAGYDTITIHSATLATTNAFVGTGVTLLNAAVANYAYTVGPLAVFGAFSATNSAGPPPAPIVANSFAAITPSASGGITVNATNGDFTLLGVTIAQFPPPVNSTETDNLVIKADFVFRGQPGVPEPTTAALLGLGLLGLLAAGRRYPR